MTTVQIKDGEAFNENGARFEDQNFVIKELLPDSAFGRPKGILEVLDGTYPVSLPPYEEVEQFFSQNFYKWLDRIDSQAPKKQLQYRTVVRFLPVEVKEKVGQEEETDLPNPKDTAILLMTNGMTIQDYDEGVQTDRRNRLKVFKKTGIPVLIQGEEKLIVWGEEVMKMMSSPPAPPVKGKEEKSVEDEIDNLNRSSFNLNVAEENDFGGSVKYRSDKYVDLSLAIATAERISKLSPVKVATEEGKESQASLWEEALKKINVKTDFKTSLDGKLKGLGNQLLEQYILTRRD